MYRLQIMMACRRECRFALMRRLHRALKRVELCIVRSFKSCWMVRLKSIAPTASCLRPRRPLLRSSRSRWRWSSLARCRACGSFPHRRPQPSPSCNRRRSHAPCSRSRHSVDRDDSATSSERRPFDPRSLMSPPDTRWRPALQPIRTRMSSRGWG